MHRIESGSVHESRQWLDLHWIKQRELIAAIDKANYGKDANKETAKRLLSEYGQRFDETNEENQQNIQHVMRLFYFYADLAKCVELGLCDDETACNLFADDIGKFYILHSEFISKWREVSFDQNFSVIKSLLNTTCAV